MAERRPLGVAGWEYAVTDRDRDYIYVAGYRRDTPAALPLVTAAERTNHQALEVLRPRWTMPSRAMNPERGVNLLVDASRAWRQEEEDRRWERLLFPPSVLSRRWRKRRVLLYSSDHWW